MFICFSFLSVKVNIPNAPLNELVQIVGLQQAQPYIIMTLRSLW